jgi:drug/metabolite transporter (DMT)-like permease
MIAAILALGAAVSYGAADFLGGLLTRRVNVFSVVLLSQLLGALVVAAILPFASATEPAQGLVWGAAAGIAGGTGVILLYRGLAGGRMTVVAPITAVEAASFPVVFGLATGERPGTAALVGVGLALVAVALVSSSAAEPQQEKETVTGETARASGVPEALGAGLGFGAFFILLDRAGDDSGLWPLMGTKMTSVLIVAVLLAVTRMPVFPERSLMVPIAWAGILDMAANLLYLLAAREGLLSIAAVLTSMYPASTVLLARVVLKERFARAQVAGLGLAATAVVLIAGT